MSLAERTRKAVREQPFLHDALGAGVVNYTAAARFLDIGEVEAVAAALRRYGEELAYEPSEGKARVTMQSGLGHVAAGADDVVLSVDEQSFALDSGSLTAIQAVGEISARGLSRVLGHMAIEDVDVAAVGMSTDSVYVIVERPDGPTMLRIVENVLDG